MHKLCDLCRKPFQTTFKHYVTQRSQGYELWCTPCTEKRNSSMRAGKCEDCGAGFKSSAYWFLRKKTDFPVKCSACRLANRDKMRQALSGGSNPEDEQRQPQQRRQGPKMAFNQLMGNFDANFPGLPE